MNSTNISCETTLLLVVFEIENSYYLSTVLFLSSTISSRALTLDYKIFLLNIFSFNSFVPPDEVRKPYSMQLSKFTFQSPMNFAILRRTTLFARSCTCVHSLPHHLFSSSYSFLADRVWLSIAGITPRRCPQKWRQRTNYIICKKPCQ